MTQFALPLSQLIKTFSGKEDAPYKNWSDQEKQEYLEYLGYSDLTKYLSYLKVLSPDMNSDEVYNLNYKLSDYSKYHKGRDLMISDNLDESKILLTSSDVYDKNLETNNPFVTIIGKDQSGNKCEQFSFYLKDIETYTTKNANEFERCNVLELPIYRYAKELYNRYIEKGLYNQNDGNKTQSSKRKSKKRQSSKRKSKRSKRSKKDGKRKRKSKKISKRKLK